VTGVLPGTLARLKATDPNIRARLQQGRTEDLLPLLASGEIELIVGRLYAPSQEAAGILHGSARMTRRIRAEFQPVWVSFEFGRQ
jgi:DNA-binding transcriptional LysR family regulator